MGREVRGKSKECNVPETEREESTARRKIKMRSGKCSLNWSTETPLESLTRGMQKTELY